MWDPTSQTYAGGVVPSHESAMDVDELLALNGGRLKIFGYGSLCWHPGSDGVLSLANIEEDERDHHDGYDAASNPAAASRSRRRVTTAPGRAIGYQRCWSQRSADHRGTPEFNGIVCTLLSDEEVRSLRNRHHRNRGEGRDAEPAEGATARPSMTEGLIYTVDVDLVDDCLAELDFREKGGYARDVIDVVEDDTGNTVKALLYRGTPDNPAFWERAFLDLPLAAAVISVSLGPSGPNDVYLFRLHSFLAHAAQHSRSAALALEDHSGDFRTGELATMVKLLQSDYRPYFLFGAGSNEHCQLLLRTDQASGDDCEGGTIGECDLQNADEFHELTEILLVAPRHNDEDEGVGEKLSAGNAECGPRSLHAGGGHSALLTCGGDLYLWGWNHAGQLGRALTSKPIRKSTVSRLNPVQPLSNMKVEVADLGHAHTVVIEKGTGRLFGFGENGRGQVDGRANGNAMGDPPHVPRTPLGLSEEHFVDAAAGLFHSAAITKQGLLTTWGCGRFGQCLGAVNVVKNDDGSPTSTVGRWRPSDGSKLARVACGRRHTVALDDRGRIWTLGDNKYGQLGRFTDPAISNKEPQLVEGQLGKVDSGCFAIYSGWSHILALCHDKDSGEVTLYGWGRNDKGQLGTGSEQSHVPTPQMLKPSCDAKGAPIERDGSEGAISIQSACCGAESSHVLDVHGDLYSAGWNEHSNLAIGPAGLRGSDHSALWMAALGKRVVAPPPSRAERKLFAAGGAHTVTMAA